MPVARTQPPKPEWSPMDTAPKDGTDILVTVVPGGRQMVARWDGTSGVTGAFVVVDRVAVEPTHWYPLPELPTQGQRVDPPPTLTALDPATAALGDPSFTLRVLGTGFTDAAIILWNGAPEPTTVVSATEVTTTVNMATAQVAIDIPVAVQNGSGGALSNALTFTLTDPVEPPAAGKRGRPPSRKDA